MLNQLPRYSDTHLCLIHLLSSHTLMLCHTLSPVYILQVSDVMSGVDDGARSSCSLCRFFSLISIKDPACPTCTSCPLSSSCVSIPLRYYLSVKHTHTLELLLKHSPVSGGPSLREKRDAITHATAKRI